MDLSAIKISLGDYGKAAKTLINRLFNVIEAERNPSLMVKTAEAAAKVALIVKRSEIDLTKLDKKYLRRRLKFETNRELNFENIAAKALPSVSESAKPQDMDADWISNFYEKGRQISDEDMQQIWAKVLAGEANEPGSYSRRAVNILSDLGKGDAELFAKLCNFGWTANGFELARLRNQTELQPTPHILPVITTYRETVYQRCGLNYATLQQLDSLGLITFIPPDVLFHKESSIWWSDMQKRDVVSYFGQKVEICFEKPNYDKDLYAIPLGQVLLTRAGYEISRIVKASPVDGFFEFTVNYWKAHKEFSVIETASRA